MVFFSAICFVNGVKLRRRDSFVCRVGERPKGSRQHMSIVRNGILGQGTPSGKCSGMRSILVEGKSLGRKFSENISLQYAIC